MTAPVRGFPERFPVRDLQRPPRRGLVARWVFRGCIRLVAGRRLHIEGEEYIPADGPLLVACNHLSNLDPMLFGGYFPHSAFAMAKREIFSPPIMAWMLAGCNTFPVDRGSADRQALRTATEILTGGGRLLVFIEGTRARGEGMRAAEPGAGFLVRRTRPTILPMALWGTEQVRARLPRPSEIHLRYGRPFTVAEGGDSQAVADQIAAHVAALLPPRYRGVHAAGATALIRGA